MIFDKKNISKIKREINGTVKLIAVEKLLTKNIHPFKKIEKLKKNKFIINFSSGSTGKPKEIIYSQNLKIERSKQLQQNFNVTERDIFINYAPIYHSLGQRLTFSSLLHLNTIILMKKFNFAEWENNINRYKATILFPISSHLSLLVKSLNKNFKKYKSVKKIIASSSQISRKTKQIITKKYNRLFFETYGAAEIAFASILTPDDPKSKKNSVGKPPKDVIIKILKKKGNKYGEICCKTKFLSSFTFKEKKNKKIFFKESFFKTGDVGYLDNDNYLYFISRLKDIIIKSGVNIVPKKIEDVILSDNLIKNCAVIGVKDEIFGETPLAICELKKKNDKNINIFENNLRKKLSRTLFPSEIVYTDTIKFLPSGKINKVFYKEKYKRFIFNKGKSELFV